jgi:signal peptidase II
MLILWLAAVVALLDQLTKLWIRSEFYLGQSRPVVDGLLNLTYVSNTGAAWGMLQDQNFFLAALSLVVLLLLLSFRRVFLRNTAAHRVGMGLMVGGILGNLMDRLRIQHVVDFLDFHWGGHHFPSFNVADSAICVGVGVYILTEFLRGQREERAGDSHASP